MNPLDFLLRNPSGRDAGNIARQRLNARAAVPKSGGGVPRATGGFLANPIFAAYAIPGYSEQKSRNAAVVIEGTRGPLNELQYIGGELLRGRMPYSKPLNAIQTGKYGPTDWNPSANPLRVPSADVVAERSYQQEKARVTQMTEQDPMFKKYKVAELTKAYNTASPEEKNKIGLQIWATTNPELAAKLKPGQTGYQEAYDLLGTQTFGTGQPVRTKVNFEQSTEKAGAPTPELPTGFAQAYTNPVPNFGMGINMQQTAYAPEGQSAPEMVSPDFSNVPLMSPPKELVDLMKNRAFKQAFESRIK
jgi:hypothetical protein